MVTREHRKGSQQESNINVSQIIGGFMFLTMYKMSIYIYNHKKSIQWEVACICIGKNTIASLIFLSLYSDHIFTHQNRLPIIIQLPV